MLRGIVSTLNRAMGMGVEGVKATAAHLGTSAGVKGLVRGVDNAGNVRSGVGSLVGKYTPVGGLMRFGAYGATSHGLAMASENIESIPGYDDMSPAGQFMLRTGLTMGSYYAGYRGLKTGARGLAGGVQGAMNAGRSRFVQTGMGSNMYAGPRDKVMPPIMSPATQGPTAGTMRKMGVVGESTRFRVNRRDLPSGHTSYAPGSSSANITGVRVTPVTAAPFSRIGVNTTGRTNVIRGFDRLAQLPGRTAMGLTGMVSSGMGQAVKGLAVGPFEYGGVAMKALGLWRQKGGPWSRGLLTGGGVTGAVKEGIHAFGNMSHPYAGAFALSAGMGTVTAAMDYNMRRKGRRPGVPMMKSGNMRPMSNMAPNVTFIAHQRNRGM